MGIFPNIGLNQIAVYWAAPVKDGEGGFTWAAPVEIECRWNDTVETVLASDGKEFVSKSKVHVDQDVVRDGMLFLGCLDDLDSSEEADPITSDDAYKIRRIDKIPTVDGQEFFRRVWL